MFCGTFYKKKEDFISTEAQTRALAVAGVATHNNNQLVYSYVMAALFPAASGTSSHHACHRNFTTSVCIFKLVGTISASHHGHLNNCRWPFFFSMPSTSTLLASWGKPRSIMRYASWHSLVSIAAQLIAVITFNYYPLSASTGHPRFRMTQHNCLRASLGPVTVPRATASQHHDAFRTQQPVTNQQG